MDIYDIWIYQQNITLTTIQSQSSTLMQSTSAHFGSLLSFLFSLPHSVKASLSLSPTGPGQVGSSGGSPTSKMGYCGGVPVEDMQSLTIASLSAADVAKQYEHIRELGKGTYGKVDLVAHRTQGELIM